jgi:hypothetical protein
VAPGTREAATRKATSATEEHLPSLVRRREEPDRDCAIVRKTVGTINPPLTTIVRATRTQFQAHSAIGTIQIVVLAHRECRMTGVKQT